MRIKLVILVVFALFFAFVSDKTVMAQTKTASSGAEVKLPEGWSTYRLYSNIDRVWDSSVLPAVVPKEIPGVLVGETQYKSFDQESLQDRHSVGRMEFPDSRYEEWGLRFQCTKAQLNTFLSAISANGFIGGETEDQPLTYEFAGKGYYAALYAWGAENKTFDHSVAFQITPAVHALPKTFFGTKLPQVGIATESYDNWELQAYDDNGETTSDYNLKTDKGKLPKYYVAWFTYYFITENDIRAYVKQMQSEGWVVKYTVEDDKNYGYAAKLDKDGMFAYCKHNAYDFEFELSFSNVEEMLTY